MAGLYEIWRLAEVSRRLDVLSGFVAMCAAKDDAARRRLTRLVADADAALSASPRMCRPPRRTWTNSSGGLTRSGPITRTGPWRPGPRRRPPDA
ncbi:hypothetical protein ID875_26545 [Streptomyces globisporus]|uniref:Uncharacterized protein n=1 Tax=Streptomyces globisporus TaxID=1908 RepID=A0A927BP34_STRGL|nr:hypothetical protein [Streptomyces globisporus]